LHKHKAMNHIIQGKEAKFIDIKEGQIYFSIGEVKPSESKFILIFTFDNDEHFSETFNEKYVLPINYSFNIDKGADKIFKSRPKTICIKNESNHPIDIYATCW
jgi:hypothetical protein